MGCLSYFFPMLDYMSVSSSIKAKTFLVSDQQILGELEKAGIVVFTPSRRIGGKRVVCYDDRYILKLAVETDGIVVSNDNYRDLISESDAFKLVVEERLLMYSFVNDRYRADAIIYESILLYHSFRIKYGNKIKQLIKVQLS